MHTPGRQSNLAGSWWTPGPADVSLNRAQRRQMWLSIETILVTMGTFAIVRMLNGQPGPDRRWILIPAVLVAAALIPTWLARRPFPRIGHNCNSIKRALGAVGIVCLFALPITFAGQWLATRLHLPIPLRPVFATRAEILPWLLYQFLYVAVAEEVFFRGYIQANTMRLLARWKTPSAFTRQWIGILVSAGCFAMAHVVVQGQALSLLTFLPGLLLAWLLVRTRTLLAPILFHGLANGAYGIIATMLA